MPATTRTARSAVELENLLDQLGASHISHTRAPKAANPNAGWFGWISYDAGTAFEPAACAAHPNAASDRTWPLASFQRIENFVEVGVQEWRTRIGALDAEVLEALSAAVPSDRPPYRVGRIDAAANRREYVKGVERVLEFIRAGDVYQVNLAHRLMADFEGSARCLFADLAERARPWHGGYFEADGYALASMSPELFLEADFRSGTVRTRPMKGTRAFAPGTDDAARSELHTSAKDRAELAMIVDLMRNDLGRTCELGSVRVEQERRIERHQSGVLQATATIAGTMRRNTSLRDLLLATFPPGSVTGAPKIRAMQIIDELEPVKRGPYCGTMIWLGDDGKIETNVMIRTACFTRTAERSTLDYSAGAGIVAESVGATEWEETMAKAALILNATEVRERQAARRTGEDVSTFHGITTR